MECRSRSVSIPHCKYFMWLDKHNVELGANSFGSSGDGVEDIREHFSLIQVENRVAELEYRVAAMEKKKNIHVRLIVVAVLVSVAAIYVIGS
ncbi:hypothetical protein PIB30_022299 [Stylosanthes scabra]|uniref:Uncharacterized protein n=1 Tax=Stylosanthes scabra TaxID=79078 RepID=A0ABU6T8X9_9FABA|nr:hypothetical protein [Stylosanthes scabra]